MKNKKIIILLTFVATLMILCSYNIVNATKNNVNGFITLDQPPGLLLKANEEKFDNVQVTLKDDDGIKTNTIKIYALDNAGKVIKNATFLVGNPTISKDQKNVTYTVSNKYLNKQTKKFRIIAEDKNGKTLDSSFRIMGKATHYTRDFPPRLKELNFNSKENTVSFILRDNKGIEQLTITDINKSNSNVKFNAPDIKKGKVETKVTVNLANCTADKNGNYKLKITAQDGNADNKQYATRLVSFSVGKFNMKLSKSTVSLSEGENITISPTVKFGNTNINLKDAKIVYTSSNTKIATVSNSGKIVAKKAGTAKITVIATYGKNSAMETCTVTIKAKEIEVKGIKLNVTKKEMAVEGELQLKATLNPTSATNQKVTWRSDNTSIATVNNNGKVKAKAEGTATIIAQSANGIKATCKIIAKRTEYASYSDSSIKVKTELIDNVYVTKIWVKDPSKQVKKASAPWGSLKTVEQQMKDKSNAIVACNGGGFMRDPFWVPGENSLYRTLKLNWDKTPSGNLVLTNGKIMRALKYANGVELKTSGQVGILPNGSFKLYNGTTYQKVIDDGVKNTFTFSAYMLIDNGVINSMCDSTQEAMRNCVGQIDGNNYVILTSYSNETIKRMAEVGKKVGCKYLYNFDGGGSTTLWMKNLVAYHPKIGEIRPVADSLYFTTTQKYSEKNGNLYKEVKNNLGDYNKYLWGNEIM